MASPPNYVRVLDRPDDSLDHVPKSGRAGEGLWFNKTNRQYYTVDQRTGKPGQGVHPAR